MTANCAQETGYGARASNFNFAGWQAYRPYLRDYWVADNGIEFYSFPSGPAFMREWLSYFGSARRGRYLRLGQLIRQDEFWLPELYVSGYKGAGPSRIDDGVDELVSVLENVLGIMHLQDATRRRVAEVLST